MKAVADLELSSTWQARDKSSEQFEVRTNGLIFLLNEEGQIVVRAPFEQWSKRLNLHTIWVRIEEEGQEQRALLNVIEKLMNRVRIYIHMAAIYARTEEKSLARFFKNIIRVRAVHFINRYQRKCERHEIDSTRKIDIRVETREKE